jgi:hypothetical protein
VTLLETDSEEECVLYGLPDTVIDSETELDDE